MSHTFHPSVIREYDMRGVYNETLREADAFALGRAFAQWVNGPVAVGRDGRVSSPSLQRALIEGLRAGGVDVTDVGVGPTPMLYFAVKTLPGMKAGIMVTGSHNPPTHNGFKMMRIEGSVHGDQIVELAQRATQLSPTATETQGSLTTMSVTADYIQAMQDKAGDYLSQVDASQTFVWDCGNGAAGAVVPQLVAQLPGTHVVMYPELDGSFPHHHPDPTVEENLIALKETVKQRKAAVGLAFDGDGDRLGIVDEHARFVPMDDLIALFAADVLGLKQGATIIADVKCGPQLFAEISRLGGRPVMWRTGHSPIKAKMAESGAPFAGEYSGHLFFADRYYGFDDGVYAALRVLNILAREKKPLSQLLAHIPVRTGLPELRLEVADDQKFFIVERFKDLIQAHPHFPKDGKVITIDGIRVETPDGWLLLRASNTQGALVLRVEGRSKDALEKLQSLIKDVFDQLSLTDLAEKIAA